MTPSTSMTAMCRAVATAKAKGRRVRPLVAFAPTGEALAWIIARNGNKLAQRYPGATVQRMRAADDMSRLVKHLPALPE